MRVLGEELGHVDVRSHRRSGGRRQPVVRRPAPAPAHRADIVMTAKNAALEPWWHDYDAADRERALALLDRFGCAALAERTFAHAVVGRAPAGAARPHVDGRPGTGAARRGVRRPRPRRSRGSGRRLADLAADPTTPATVLVTHHVDEIPAGFTHVLLLKAGRVLARGPIDDVLTAPRAQRLLRRGPDGRAPRRTVVGLAGLT